MNTGKISSELRGVLTVAAVALSLCVAGEAQSESTLFSFTTSGPRYTVAGLISDAGGNLYGTTSSGGNSPSSGCGRPGGCGTVFELSPSGSGWTETVLYSFNGGANGVAPGATLVFDPEGNLYGTTSGYGQVGADTVFPGTIFELSPTSSGWTHKVLHEFTGGKDGLLPDGPLIIDGAGNLYGTAVYGGDLTCGGPPQPPGCGLAFKLEHTAAGGWAEIVLHAFTGTDGSDPQNGLTWDTAGNLYGTAAGGGFDCLSDQGCGILYRLTPLLGGGWKFAPIHKFTGGEDGDFSSGQLVFDASGVLYGSASGGGVSNFGIVFRLAPTSKGGWDETVIYSFAGGTDGAFPGPVVLGPDGILYGTTFEGGKPNGCSAAGCGTVFSITPISGGWGERVLHAFSFPDGSSPNGVMLSGGNLYGTTFGGGSEAVGVVFEVTP